MPRPKQKLGVLGVFRRHGTSQFCPYLRLGTVPAPLALTASRRRAIRPVEVAMAEVRIRPLENGPVEVSGVVLMVDPAGQAAPPSESPIYLCRCGQSADKPFCDGTHKKCGFRAPGWTRASSKG
jgi:CDGSH-type Zn-finger protein